MSNLISDEMLNTMGIMAAPSDIVPEIKQRYGDFMDRTSGAFGFVDQDTRTAMVAALRAG